MAFGSTTRYDLDSWHSWQTNQRTVAALVYYFLVSYAIHRCSVNACQRLDLSRNASSLELKESNCDHQLFSAHTMSHETQALFKPIYSVTKMMHWKR